MTLPAQGEPVGWDVIHDAHRHRERVAVCTSAPVRIPYDQHGGPPERAAGDYVGHVLRIDQDTFTIGGWSFNTVIKWADVRGAWLRNLSPNPCICGKVYNDEPRREAPRVAS